MTATALELPAIGSEAPDFTLPAASGNTVTLSALRGHIVLLAFFPLAFTRVCTAEMGSFNSDLGDFRGVKAEVLPISVDSIPTLKEFKAKEHLTMDLLSDFKRDVSRLYGTLLEDKFFSQRAYVLIDRDGIVRWTYAEEHSGTRRENSELLAEIAKLA
jgi:peroxiredoxin